MSAAEGATPLMYACQQSREKEVLEILSRKRNSVRERDRTLKTPLHYCAENSSTACAEAVLRAAPELLEAADEDGYTALHLAVIAGNKTFLRFLISRGANVNALDNERHSAVHWATVCGEEEALEIVQRAGADVSTADIHGGYPLHYAAQMCGPGVEMGRDPKIGLRILNILLSQNIDINAKDKDGRQPILWAASAGSADAILALVKAGASVEASDKDGLTALHCAASRGHTDCLETLITLCGASVDVIDSNGCTALFYAVTLGHADATQLLLSLGAEPNRQDRKGRTPAHCGAAKGQLETLRILLNYGANLWLRNVKGDFPLHEAVASGRRDLVLWLLNQRLDSNNIGNNDGRCPIHIAAINNNIDMIKILFDAQSLVNPIMRTTKGILMTPLDAALHRGFRGCAKYLQLHGGVPFSKLTEKSSNIKGIPSRKADSEMYAKNMRDQFEISHWGQPRTSAATLTSFVPSQIRMGGDTAIQQIETSHIRAVTRIEDDYDDIRSSDDNKIHRRRRRRKKADYREKGYISEEDSNFEDHPRSVELPRRKVKTSLDDDRYRRQKKKEQYDESSSESDYYRRKTMKKKNSSSDSDEKNNGCKSTNRDRRKYHSEIEASENEERGDEEKKSKKEERHKICVEPYFSLAGDSDVEKDDGTTSKKDNNSFRVVKLAKEKEVNQTTIITIERAVSENVSEAKSELTLNSQNNETNYENENAQEVEDKDSQQLDIDPPVMVINDNSEQPIDADDVNIINHNTPDNESETADITADQLTRQDNLIEAPANEVSENVDVTVRYYTENETNNGHNNNSQGDNKNEENLNNDEDEIKLTENATFDAEDPTEGQKSKIEEELDTKTEETELDTKIAETPLEVEETETEKVDEAKKINEDVNIASVDLLREDEIIENIAEDITKPEEEFIEFPSDVEEEIPDERQDENRKLTPDLNEGKEVKEAKEEQNSVNDSRNEENEITFQLLDNSSNPEHATEKPYLKKKNSKLFHEDVGRGSSNSTSKGYRIADAEGSMGDESGGSTRNEDSSALPDSGIEPSPRRKLKDPVEKERDSIRSRVPRLCNKGREEEKIHSISVTQTVQNTIRKYQVERKIFYQLLELKRLQIRAGRANEQVLVKRLVDEYRRGGIIPGLKNYSGHYTFRQFEKFLYDQLRTLQSTAHVLIPKIKPSDDIETLSTILRKTRVELIDDIPDNPIFCTQGTHRCHHAAHAYTGIPCAAYITKFNHHEMPKTKSPGFLPYIDQVYPDRHFGQQASFRPVTLELSHGKEKQVISLPTDRLDKNKRYYVTFTIKGGPMLEETKSARQEERMLRHRHAKSF